MEIHRSWENAQGVGGWFCPVCGNIAYAVTETVTQGTGGGDTTTRTYSHGTRQCTETVLLPELKITTRISEGETL